MASVPRQGCHLSLQVSARRCGWYDRGGRRHRRTLRLGSIPTYPEAGTPRVSCRTDGAVVVAFLLGEVSDTPQPGIQGTGNLARQKHVIRSAVEEPMCTAWSTV